MSELKERIAEAIKERLAHTVEESIEDLEIEVKVEFEDEINSIADEIFQNHKESALNYIKEKLDIETIAYQEFIHWDFIKETIDELIN